MSSTEPTRTFRITFALIMGFLMVGVVTFVTTAVNFGWQAGFFAYWGKTYLVGYVAAVPAIYAFAPVARGLTNTVLKFSHQAMPTGH